MDDLAAALQRLADAFPDDPGPAADPFRLKDRYDIFVYCGTGVFVDDFDLAEQMRIWPPPRRAAVEDVLRAWWTTTITHHPTFTDVLAVVTHLTVDVEPWLATWSADGVVAAAFQLRDFLQGHFICLPRIDDFDEDAANDAIDRWLRRDGVDILCALPPGLAQDSTLAKPAKRESCRWW